MEDLLDAYSIFGVLFEDLIDEGLGFGRGIGGVLVGDIYYLLHGLLAADVVEGSLAADHLVGKHPDTPNVHAIIIALPSDDLRAHVVQGTAVSSPPIGANGRPAKITQLADILNNKKHYICQHDVLWLDIAMQNRMVMHFLDPQTDLFESIDGLGLGKLLLLLDEVEDVASFHVFHDDVEVGGVVEETIEFDDVRVIQEHLYLYLVDELF